MLEDVQTILRPLIARYAPRVRAGARITSADYFAAHRARMAKAGKPLRTVETPLLMRVNHGRWCGDCACGAALATGLLWREARCFGCGAVYVNVVWPDLQDLAQITKALARRPDAVTRNWLPSEHWAALVAENLAHGLAEVIR